jgi:hypothetical protein
LVRNDDLDTGDDPRAPETTVIASAAADDGLLI